MSKKKITISPDSVYDSIVIAKFINQVMRKGKKTVAERIVYQSLEGINKKTKKDSLEVFEEALKNASPLLEVKSKRIGGATYQVPVPVEKDRKTTLAIRWIIEAARSKKGKPMAEKLAEELIAAAENTGKAVKKRENIHRMAEANRAFAHFSW